MNKLLALLFLLFFAEAFPQQTDYVDFKKGVFSVEFNVEDKAVIGKGSYDFSILKETDSVFIDAVSMEFAEVLLNGKPIQHNNDGKKLWLLSHFKTDYTYNLTFNYTATPKKALYFVGWDNVGEADGVASSLPVRQTGVVAEQRSLSGAEMSRSAVEKQIWTQGQGQYTSNWLPSFDDVNEKLEFDLSIQFKKPYQVFSNGKLIDVERLGHSEYYVWHYDMQKPMSSYLVALVIGDYDVVKETSASGVPLQLYYYPEDSAKVEPTYRYTKQIFDVLETEIGVAYPWQNHKQVPVHDFLYAGMENTSLTIFSDVFVVDEAGFNDQNYVNVNAHELAHQWFGNLVTAKSGKHHWLQEGFSTYYALLAERAVFGDNYFYFRLLEYIQELEMQDTAGNGTALLNPKASSTTFYKRGCWALFALRKKIGDVAFRKAVKSYLEKHQFSSATTDDFIKEAETESGQDLTEFVEIWLKAETFPKEKARELLLQSSTFINEYNMVDCEAKHARCQYFLESGISDEAKAKIVRQVPELVTPETFLNGQKVRLAIAESVSTIPSKLKASYETLLEDVSYKTVEAALYHLWVNFPEDRKTYLEKTSKTIGTNKNVRLLWLTLALNMPEFLPEEKQQHYNALVSYTNPEFNADIRMGAFQYLKALNACNDQCQANLQQATKHHNWRMVTFAKNQISN